MDMFVPLNRDIAAETFIRTEGPQIIEISTEKFYRCFEENSDEQGDLRTNIDGKLIQKDDIFDNELGAKNRGMHVMVVGPVGSGKTHILLRVSESTCTTYWGSFVIFFLNFRGIPPDVEIDANDFIFKDQRCSHAPRIRFPWLMQNPKKALFIIDSLDTIQFQPITGTQFIGPHSKALPGTHLSHLLSQEMFPGCQIVSSARPYSVRNYTGKLRPDRVIIVGEMTDQTVRNLAYCYMSYKSEDVMKVWDCKKPMMTLCRTPGVMMANVIGLGAKGDFSYPVTLAGAMINFVTAVLHSDHIFSYFGGGKKKVIHVINKMKDLALHGMKKGKAAFTMEDLAKFNITEKEIKGVCLLESSSGEHAQRLFRMRGISETNAFEVMAFQEFLCALKIIEMPPEEFRPFVSENIHKPWYSVVRQIMCGILLRGATYDIARNYLLRATSEDQEKSSFLQKNMAEQFYHVKRYALLDYFLAVGAVERRRLDSIMPRDNVDEIDLSGIPLFMRDALAVGACIAQFNSIGHLNLSDCNLDSETFYTIVRHLILAEFCTKITKLSLNRNDFTWNDDAMHGLCGLVKTTKVQDLSLNCCNLTHDVIRNLDTIMEGLKMKTLSVNHNETLGFKGFAMLGNFAMKHDLEEVHMHHCGLTQKLCGVMKSYHQFEKTGVYIQQTTK